MDLSKSDKRVISAYVYGYRVLEDGTVVNSNTGRVLKPYINTSHGKGYAVVSIRFDGKKTHAFVHRLQAYQKFQDLCFRPNIVVRHLNSNSLDNSYANIALGVQRDNVLDRPVKDRQLHAKKAAKVRRKLSEEQLAEFKVLREAGFSLKQLATRFSIAKSTASYIVNNKTYK